ncbi:MAG: MTH895/ArsE family thioredoxin-like protein [Spirochaetaceae bacterium]
MTIQILGTGCPNCRQLEKNAREAVSRLGMEADFEKVTDMNRITEMGVLRTPGLAFDGELQQTGKVLSPEEIEEKIKAHLA